jgi:hypothetical protein
MYTFLKDFEPVIIDEKAIYESVVGSLATANAIWVEPAKTDYI